MTWGDVVIVMSGATRVVHFDALCTRLSAFLFGLLCLPIEIDLVGLNKFLIRGREKASNLLVTN